LKTLNSKEDPEIRILGQHVSVPRRGSVDLSHESRSYSQIQKMMKNIEEYGKNLEQQQNLNQVEKIQS